MLRISILALAFYLAQACSTAPKKEKELELVPDDTVRVVGLGIHEVSDLDTAASIVSSFWKCPAVVRGSVPASPDMYRDSALMDYEVLYSLRKSARFLYITDEPLFSDTVELRGAALVWCNNMVVRGDLSFMRGTIIHEMGHLHGLEHCANLACVMAVDNDEYDTGDLCAVCRKMVSLGKAASVAECSVSVFRRGK